MDSRKYRYNHMGIPTKTKQPNEKYIPAFRMYVSGYGENAFNIEWMRFEEGCQLPRIVQELPHVAFEVDDLEAAIKGKEVIIQPNSPSDGITVAFIVENGAPVELMEFGNKED